MDEKSKKTPPSGKNNLAAVLIIIGAVIIVLIFAGIFAGRYLWQKVQSNIEATPTAATSEEAGRGGGGGLPSPGASGPTSQDFGAVWPPDLSTNILPVYSGGTIAKSGKTTDPGSYSIQITGSTQTEFDAYKNLLLSQGWTIKNPNDFRANNYLLQKTGASWDLTLLKNNNGVLISLMEQV